MFPPVIQGLILANVGIFLMQSTSPDMAWSTLALWPLGPMFQPWQLITYAFLHASFSHVLFNMLGLFMFGADLERVWGGRRFIAYYGICVISAGLAQLGLTAWTGQLYPTIGASGGVFGLLLAYALYFPRRIVMPLFPPIPMPAPMFAMIYGGLELFLGLSGAQSGVAHFAHLGGMLGGYLVIQWWRRGRLRFH